MSEDTFENAAGEATPFVPPAHPSPTDDPVTADLDHLPPPAFPPSSGSETRASAMPIPAGGGDSVATEDESFSDDAFIDPDEPIVRTRPPEKPADFEEVVRGHNEGEEVVVTGIGDDPHLDELERIPAEEQYGDPHVARLVRMVGALADALRERGEAGLRTTADMTRFEATLRAYCVGYLAGARKDED